VALKLCRLMALKKDILVYQMFKVMFFGFLTSSDILVLKFILVFISFISNRFFVFILL